MSAASEWGKTIVGVVGAGALSALVTAGSYKEKVNTNTLATEANKAAIEALKGSVEKNRDAIHAGEVERGKLQTTLAAATESIKNARLVLQSLRDRLLDGSRHQ